MSEARHQQLATFLNLEKWMFIDRPLSHCKRDGNSLLGLLSVFASPHDSSEFSNQISEAGEEKHTIFSCVFKRSLYKSSTHSKETISLIGCRFATSENPASSLIESKRCPRLSSEKRDTVTKKDRKLVAVLVAQNVPTIFLKKRIKNFHVFFSPI